MASPLTITSGSGDGYVRYSNGSWSTCRNASTGNATDTINPLSTQCVFVALSTYYIARTLLPFDTSTVPVGSNITQVDLKCTPQNVWGTGETNKVVTTSNTVVDTAAYAIANWGSSALGSFTTGTQEVTQTITLTGATINGGGTTYLGLRGLRDIDDTSPASLNQTAMYSSEATTSSYRPQLVVTYTDAALDFTKFFIYRT